MIRILSLTFRWNDFLDFSRPITAKSSYFVSWPMDVMCASTAVGFCLFMLSSLCWVVIGGSEIISFSVMLFDERPTYKELNLARSVAILSTTLQFDPNTYSGKNFSKVALTGWWSPRTSYYGNRKVIDTSITYRFWKILFNNLAGYFHCIVRFKLRLATHCASYPFSLRVALTLCFNLWPFRGDNTDIFDQFRDFVRSI